MVAGGHHIVDAYGGHIVDLLSGMPYINQTADFRAVIQALDKCNAIVSWYTGKEVSSFCDTCAGYVPDSGRANLTNFLTCSHIFYLNTQVIASALTVFEDQFFGVPGLTGAYFVQGADPVGLNIGIQRGRVDGSGFIEDGDMNLVNGTWLISSVGAPAASHSG